MQSARASAMSPKSGRADAHRDLVLLLLQSVGAGDAAALPVGLDHLELGDQPQQVERGLAETVAAALAGLVVGHAQRQRPQIGAQLARVVEVAQELADVEHALADERAGRGRRCRGSRAPRASASARSWSSWRRSCGPRARTAPAARPGRGRSARAARRPRSTAAAARSSPAAGRSPGSRCARAPRPPSGRRAARCSWRAAVEVDDLRVGRRRRGVPPRPRLERAGREVGQGRVAVDAERGLDRAPARAGVAATAFASGATGRPRRPSTRRAGDQPVAQRHARSRLHLRPRLGVDLGDVDALRAHLGADPAARAVVERRVDARRRARGSARSAGRRTWGPGRAASPRPPGRTSRTPCT